MKSKCQRKVVEKVSNQAWSEGPQWYQFAVEQLRVRLSWSRKSVSAVTASMGKISSFKDSLKTVQKLDSDLSRFLRDQSRCTEEISTNRGKTRTLLEWRVLDCWKSGVDGGNLLFLGFLDPEQAKKSSVWSTKS